MRKIALGSTSLKVTPICYGCWQASPKFWGDQPRDILIASMRKAVESGVNFFDTADAYGDGLAEEILGEALTVFPRKELVIATKVYHHFYPDGHRHPDLSYKYILQECDASMKRMRIDYIDLYQVHQFDPLTHIEETTRALEQLKASGKIRHYGASNFTVEQLRWAHLYGTYETLQPRYSLIDTEGERDTLPYCRAQEMGVLAYSPLHHGLLAGKYTGEETFDDFRRFKPEFLGDKFRKITSAVKSLESLAEQKGLSLVQLVLAATLASPLVDCVIVGVKRPEQIEEAAKAGDVDLTRQDYYAVRSTLTGVL